MGGLSYATQLDDMLAVLNDDENNDHENYDDSSYVRALTERLRQIRDELEGQGNNAIILRQKVMGSKRSYEISNQELVKLRAVWAADQPRRDAFVSETGETERRLAERERRCAEAWAAQAAARCSSRPTTPGASKRTPASNAPASETLPRGSDTREEQEQKQRITTMDNNRLRMQRAVVELTESAKQDGKAIQQLRGRIESLRGESDSLKSAADAAKVSVRSYTGRLEALDATMSAGEQKQMSLERQVASLQHEVQNLRDKLKDKSDEVAEMASEASARNSKAKTKAKTRSTSQPPQTTEENSACEEEAVWATNKKLQDKVLALREELRKRLDDTGAQI